MKQAQLVANVWSDSSHRLSPLVMHGVLSGYALLLIGLLLVFTGCGSSDDRVAVYPVEGQITVNGQPLAGVQVVFHPAEINGLQSPPATARTDADGRFELSTYDARDGAAAGTYQITVHYYPVVRRDDAFLAMANTLPARYATASTTNLRAEVSQGPNRLAPIDIRR